MEAAAVIVEALLDRTIIVIVVAIRKIFVVDKLHNMTERCGGVAWTVLLGVIVIKSLYNIILYPSLYCCLITIVSTG